MAKDTKRSILVCTYACLMLLCFCLADFAWIDIALEGADGWFYVFAGVLTALTILFAFLCTLAEKNYKVGYFFLGKKYKSMIIDASKKFVNASEEFIVKFQKSRKQIYRKTGTLYGVYEIKDNLGLYSDFDTLKDFHEVVSLLNDSIKTKGGFVEFCKSIKKTERDGWEINNYMHNEFVSGELGYLMEEVFELCDFWVDDSGIMAEYSRKSLNEQEKLNNVYSPILFGFADEVDLLEKKLGEIMKQNKPKKKDKN